MTTKLSKHVLGIIIIAVTTKTLHYRRYVFLKISSLPPLRHFSKIISIGILTKNVIAATTKILSLPPLRQQFAIAAGFVEEGFVTTGFDNTWFAAARFVAVWFIAAWSAKNTLVKNTTNFLKFDLSCVLQNRRYQAQLSMNANFMKKHEKRRTCSVTESIA